VTSPAVYRVVAVRQAEKNLLERSRGLSAQRTVEATEAARSGAFTLATEVEMLLMMRAGAMPRARMPATSAMQRERVGQLRAMAAGFLV